MREIYYLVKRNALFYIRDKAYIFFSILSTLIILGLMILFLGKANVDSLYEALRAYGNGSSSSEEDYETARLLITLWSLAGILVVNSLTVPLSIYSSMIKDEWTGRLQAFYVSPVSRFRLSLGYILSAWLIGTIMCLLTLLLGEGYLLVTGLKALDILTLIKTAVFAALSAFTFSALGYLLALFVHTSSAWSGILTVIGTLAGFLGGIYFRPGDMPSAVRQGILCLPVIHSSALLRNVMMKDAMTQGFAGCAEGFQEIFEEQMGIRLVQGNFQIKMKEQLIIMAAYSIIAVTAACFVSRNRKPGNQ